MSESSEPFYKVKIKHAIYLDNSEWSSSVDFENKWPFGMIGSMYKWAEINMNDKWANYGKTMVKRPIKNVLFNMVAQRCYE